MKFTSMLAAAFTAFGICLAQISTEAGATGGLSGQPHDERGVPVAGANPGHFGRSRAEVFMQAQIEL